MNSNTLAVTKVRDTQQPVNGPAASSRPVAPCAFGVTGLPRLNSEDGGRKPDFGFSPRRWREIAGQLWDAGDHERAAAAHYQALLAECGIREALAA
jgi:hypothetical protein